MRKGWLGWIAGVSLMAIAALVPPDRGSAVRASSDVPAGSCALSVAASAEPQEPDSDWARQHEAVARKLAARAERQAALLAEKLARVQAERPALLAQLEEVRAQLLAQRAELEAQAHERAAHMREQEPFVQIFDDESGWLGVTISEVTSEKAKELKLSAERGVLITEVESDSPAAKAGLKANDVVTEFNGQRVEGTVQFRRLVRETPPGRNVQLTVWRDARAQNLSVQAGSGRQHIESRVRVFGPRDFDFNIRIPDLPEIFTGSRAPVLGVSVEDISGQLAGYFGVPDDEGILVREVRAGSPAEKAGVKAGDVILKVDGERVRTTSDLRAKLREKREKKTISLGVIRKGTEMSVNVEIEPTKPPERPRVGRRIAL